MFYIEAVIIRNFWGPLEIWRNDFDKKNINMYSWSYEI